MNSNEKLGIKGNLNIVLTDAQGRIKDTRQVTNKVTANGLNHILQRLGNLTPATFMTHMAVGINASQTAEDGSSTILKTETGTRVSTTGTVAANVITYVADFVADPDGAGAGVSNPAADSAITEAGIFTQSAVGGILLCRTVFAVVNKLTTDSLRITWKITLTAS
jgi:hypothetical protein